MSIKSDSTTTFQEEQEDILMSYLNSDYMSSMPCWNTTTRNHVTPPTTPPCSTLTLIKSHVSSNNHQGFFSPSLSNDWNHHPNTPTSEEYGQPLLNEFPPFMMANRHSSIMYHQLQYLHLQQKQPASPPGSSSSSDSEQQQPKKRRGRKKRDGDSCETTTPTIMIAPAPVVKQLTQILPAAQRPNEEKGSASKYTAIPPTMIVKKEDDQKAATIAKRQERLIKNRAAALLSRKRKREHLTALEDQRHGLCNENNMLKEKLIQLEKENFELKNKLNLQQQQNCSGVSDSKSAIIMMMILFSIVYLISSTARLKNYTLSHNNDSTFQLTHSHPSSFDNNDKDAKSLFNNNRRKRFERILAL